RNKLPDTKHHNRKIAESASRKGVQEPETLVVRKKLRERGGGNAGWWNRCMGAEHHDGSEDKENAVAQGAIRCNDFDFLKKMAHFDLCPFILLHHHRSSDRLDFCFCRSRNLKP